MMIKVGCVVCGSIGYMQSGAECSTCKGNGYICIDDIILDEIDNMNYEERYGND
jgi:RecJ-like exonuclease